MKLSAAMQAAIDGAALDGTIIGATLATEAALIRRGLAKPVRGMTTRCNRYSRTAQTVYDAYLGARLVAVPTNESQMGPKR